MKGTASKLLQQALTLGVVVTLVVLFARQMREYATEQELVSVSKRVADNEQRIRALELELHLLERKLAKEREASIDCVKSRPSSSESDSGTLLVICEKAEPYLDGYRVYLLIGNPTAIAYRSADLHFTWSFSQGSSPSELQSAYRSVSEALPSGSWRPFRTELSPMTAEELANLSVSMTGEISARRSIGD